MVLSKREKIFLGYVVLIVFFQFRDAPFGFGTIQPTSSRSISVSPSDGDRLICWRTESRHEAGQDRWGRYLTCHWGDPAIYQENCCSDHRSSPVSSRRSAPEMVRCWSTRSSVLRSSPEWRLVNYLLSDYCRSLFIDFAGLDMKENTHTSRARLWKTTIGRGYFNVSPPLSCFHRVLSDSSLLLLSPSHTVAPFCC